MIVSVINQKGGAGKTMLSVNLSALVASGGIGAAIIDLDPQATASTWHQMRDKQDIHLEVCHPPLLKKATDKLIAQGVQFIVIDTPPHNSSATASAIQISEYCLIPVRPSAFDLAAAQATVDLVKQNNGNAGFVINSIPASTHVEDAAREFIKTTGLPVIGSLGQRMAFQHGAMQGLGVTEYEPSGKAASELIELWNKINEVVNYGHE